MPAARRLQLAFPPLSLWPPVQKTNAREPEMIRLGQQERGRASIPIQIATRFFLRCLCGLLFKNQRARAGDDKAGQQEQTETTEFALLFRSKSPPENLVGNERF